MLTRPCETFRLILPMGRAGPGPQRDSGEAPSRRGHSLQSILARRSLAHSYTNHYYFATGVTGRSDREEKRGLPEGVWPPWRTRAEPFESKGSRQMFLRGKKGNLRTLKMAPERL